MKKLRRNQYWFGEPPVNNKVHPPLPDELVLRLSKSQENYPVEQTQDKSVKFDQVDKYLVFPQKQQQQQQKPHHQQKGSSQQDISSKSEKNICTYIERAIINALLSQQYKHIVQKMCLKYKCQYNLAIGYFGENSEKSFGISHLIKMMTPKKQKDISINKLFNAFLKYFLRNKYLIYMLKLGKMQNKDLYLKVKNRLLYLSETIPKQRITSSNCDIQADFYQPQY